VDVLNVGLDLGFIPEKAFTMFVLMALISTVMTAPGLCAWLPRIRACYSGGRGCLKPRSAARIRAASASYRRASRADRLARRSRARASLRATLGLAFS